MKKAKHLVDDPNKHIYTLEEVAKHNKRGDCWTIWKGKIYDITSYIDKHPGGDKILAGSGKDCTKLYNKFHAYVNADYLIGNLQVGVLKQDESQPKFGAFLSPD